MAALNRENSVITGNTQKASPSHLAGHILLARLQQNQRYNISVDMTGGEVVSMHGSLDLVKWTELHVAHDAIRAALVRTGLVSASLMVLEIYLLNFDSDWNPALELWANQLDGQRFDLQKIYAVIEAVLVGLRRDASNDVDDMCEVSLDAVERQAVHQVVKETLNEIGGRRLVEPVSIEVGGTTLSLEGKLGAKQSKLNLHPREERLTGRFVGIKVDPAELLFKTETKALSLSCARPLVDFQAVLNASLSGEICEIRTQKTISVGGREIYTYQPDGPFRNTDYFESESDVARSD